MADVNYVTASKLKETRYTAQMVMQFRGRHKLAQEDLAELLGLSKSAIIMWETRQRGVSEPLARLFEMFDRNPELMRTF